MISKEIKTIVFYFIISLASLFVILWLVDFSNLGIPMMLPIVALRTYGILILIAFLSINYFFQKQLLNINPEISIFKLIILSILVILISLIIYQTVRQFMILGRPLSKQILISAGAPSIIFVFLAASTTLSLKKVKGIARQITFLLLLVSLFLIKQYFQTFEW